MRSLTDFVAVALISAAALPAQEPPKFKPWSTRVELSISAEPAALKEEIASYLRREIRSLGDVEIVEEKGDYHIDINAFEVRTKGGDVTGVAIATVLEMPFYWDSVKGVLALLTNANRKFLEDLTGLSVLRDFLLDVGARQDVPELCRQIILKIDSKAFESERKMYRQMLEALRKQGVQ